MYEVRSFLYISELLTRAISEKTGLKINYKIILYKKPECEVTDTVGFTYIPVCSVP